MLTIEDDPTNCARNILKIVKSKICISEELLTIKTSINLSPTELLSITETLTDFARDEIETLFKKFLLSGCKGLSLQMR